VIVCTGFRFDVSIFDEGCRPELTINDRFPAQTPEWGIDQCPGSVFRGTLMQVRDFKKSTSGFIHGFRYCVRALDRMLERKYHGNPWPHRRLAADPRTLTGGSDRPREPHLGLVAGVRFLCDLIVIGSDGGAQYCEELPVDYVHESEFGAAGSFFTVTLEYGPDHDQFDPFDVSVGRISQSDSERSDKGRYLHPVVRHYSQGRLWPSIMSQKISRTTGLAGASRPARGFLRAPKRLDRRGGPGQGSEGRRMTVLSLRELEAEARRRLDPAVYDSFAGGAMMRSR